MRKMIAVTCLLMAPSMLLASAETNPMTPEEIVAARQQIVGEIEAWCPDYVQKNQDSQRAGAPTVGLDEAIGVVRACFEKIGTLHEDMMLPPRVSGRYFGCSREVMPRRFDGDENCLPYPGLGINVEFKSQPAGSEASWRQATMRNILRETFEKQKVLGYESEIWPD